MLYTNEDTHKAESHGSQIDIMPRHVAHGTLSLNCNVTGFHKVLDACQVGQCPVRDFNTLSISQGKLFAVDSAFH